MSHVLKGHALQPNTPLAVLAQLGDQVHAGETCCPFLQSLSEEYCGRCVSCLAYGPYCGTIWASGVNSEEGYQINRTGPVLSGGPKYHRTEASALQRREDVVTLFPKNPFPGAQTSSSSLSLHLGRSVMVWEGPTLTQYWRAAHRRPAGPS